MKQVYVHGLGQTPASWEKTLLNQKSRTRAICPDLAEIARGKEINYSNLYRGFSDVCAAMDTPVDLCGLSLGGVLALNYAIDYPGKVHALVLIATPYKMPKRLSQFQNILFRLMPKSMFRQMGFGKTDFIMLCKSMMELDFSNALQKVSCPVLIVCGGKDTTNKKASVELADILENAKLQVIEEAGHEVNVDAPEALAKVLDDFYSKVQ